MCVVKPADEIDPSPLSRSRRRYTSSRLDTVPQMAETELRPTAERDAALDRLVAEVAAGDRTAFDALYRATSARLFGICLRVLSDRAEAEDVLQDAFVTIWHRAAQFDPDRAGAIAWLSTIARNRAIDRLRARPPMSRAPLAAIEDMADPGYDARAECGIDHRSQPPRTLPGAARRSTSQPHPHSLLRRCDL